MRKKFHDGGDQQIRQIFDLKFGIDLLFFKQFERSFELPSGLNFTHMKALLALSFHGPCSMSEISHMMIMEKGSFTPVAAKLIDKGFLNKERSIEDKRVYNLVITEPGRELTNRFRESHVKYIHSVLDGLSGEEQVEYNRLLEKLNKMNIKLEKSGA